MRSSSRLAVPLRRPEDVIPFLGERFHWKHGHSAKALADQWFPANDLPSAVREVLSREPAFADAELLDAWLERETDLEDGESGASQTDLLALLGVGDRLSVLGIEAKAGESFGPTVQARLADGSERVERRWQRLCARLGIDPGSSYALRYQLLHRTVAVLLEARRFRAETAILLVESFRDDPAGVADFRRFVDALGFGDSRPGVLHGPRPFGTVSLWIGWLDCALPRCGLVLTSIRRVTTVSPSQWWGELTDGRPVYIRYRWGELSVRIGRRGDDEDRVVATAPWFDGQVGKTTDPIIDLHQVLNATGLSLAPGLDGTA